MKTKIQLIPTENQLNYLFFAIIPLKKLKRCKSSIENPIKSIRTFRNPVNTGWNPERESGVCSSNFLHANNAFFYLKKIRRKLRGEREREREKPLPFGKFRKRRMGRWWERDVFVFFFFFAFLLVTKAANKSSSRPSRIHEWMSTTIKRNTPMEAMDRFFISHRVSCLSAEWTFDWQRRKIGWRWTRH